MEYLDIVNKNGDLVGLTQSREIVHRHGLLHRHIHVWILNSNGEVLLQRRSPNKKTYANMWAMSAEGHVSVGKTPEQTVVDEVSEELDIFLPENDLMLEFKYARGKIIFDNNWIENGINYVYLVKDDTPIEKIKIQDDEVAEVKWMHLKDYKKEIDRKNPEYRAYPEEFDWLFGFINGCPY